MANLTITEASVVAGTGASMVNGTLGETVTAGQAVYLNSSRKWMKADANGGSEIVRYAKGIALNGGAVNQPVRVLKEGQITIGATLTAGLVYFLSRTAGAICPYADLTTGDYVVQLGIAKSTTVLDVKIVYPDVVL